MRERSRGNNNVSIHVRVLPIYSEARLIEIRAGPVVKQFKTAEIKFTLTAMALRLLRAKMNAAVRPAVCIQITRNRSLGLGSAGLKS